MNEDLSGLVEEALAALRDYCADADPGDASAELLLFVRTGPQLPPNMRIRLEQDARRFTQAALGHTRVQIEPLRDQWDLAERGLERVEVRPRTDGTRPGPSGPAAPRVPPGARRLLTLRCGRFSFPQLLVPGPGWLPVHRCDGSAASASALTGIVLPGWLGPVPTRALFELRLDETGLALRRTCGRAGTQVLVDGEVRTEGPDGELLGEAGTITLTGGLTSGAERTELDYRLEQWVDAPLAPGTGRAEGGADEDGEPLRAGFEAEALLGWLDIAPPPAGVAPVRQEFPVHAPDLGQAGVPLHAEVLYTRAISLLGRLEGRDWHVKLLRTATPQHAALLYDHFHNQSVRVNALVVRSGGRVLDPPWGIAPVHPIDPWRLAAGLDEPTRTGLGPAPPKPARTDERLTGWFGTPEPSPAACVVAVVTPWLAEAALESLPAEPLLVALPDFAEMARALDLAHADDLAHCDVKPDNLRQSGSCVVLVDTDAVTDLTLERPVCRLTTPYLRAGALRPGAALVNQDLVDHDRFGFALVVLAAVAGTAWVTHALRGEPGRRIVDGRAPLAEALRGQWADAGHPALRPVDGVAGEPAAVPLIEVLAEPFDEQASRDPAWSCAGWLARAIEAANVTGPAYDAAAPVYTGPYAAAMARLRDVLDACTPGRTGQVGAVDAGIERVRGELTRAAERTWFVWPALAGLLVIVVAVALIVRSM
jgi:hypothetical protein